MAAFSADIPWVFTPAPPAAKVLSEQLADEAELLDWADAEHQVLLQATAQAASAGLITHARQILTCQAWFLGGHGYWAHCRAAGQAMLAAAGAASDHATLGWTHAIIGLYATFTGASDADRAHLRQALDHFRRACDLAGQANAHLFTAPLAARDGDWAGALTHCEQAPALFRQAGNRAGERWPCLPSGTAHCPTAAASAPGSSKPAQLTRQADRETADPPPGHRVSGRAARPR